MEVILIIFFGATAVLGAHHSQHHKAKQVAPKIIRTKKDCPKFDCRSCPGGVWESRKKYKSPKRERGFLQGRVKSIERI